MSISLFSSIAMASEQPHPPLGIVKSASDAYQNMSSCRGSAVKTLFERMTVLVAGRYRCQPAYGEAKDYLVAYYGKQRFFIENSDVFMVDEKRAALPLLDEQKLASQDFSELEQLAVVYRHHIVGEALSAYAAPAKYGISVLAFSAFDEGEYAHSTGFRLRVYNPTKKTIKYIRVELTGMNAVDDVVRDRFAGPVKKVRGIGPIEPQGISEYTFDHLWFTDTVEWPKLVSLRVDYMDGSSKTIKNLGLVKVAQKFQDVVDWENN
ncbi:hypothetical protein [Aquitalea pelogenes]|uniref:hypothetical protein n=1 Tax=Aquitalea pelogenes TaxID=1293573 RepID=UPI00128F584F|nr:hypothetical protein [Aquitalea pelogenes]